MDGWERGGDGADLLEIGRRKANMLYVSFQILGEDEDVMEVNEYEPVEQVTHHGLENCSGVGETEGYDETLKMVKRRVGGLGSVVYRPSGVPRKALVGRGISGPVDRPNNP
ncbi:unnamed protein product [Lota lota]